MRTCSCAIRMRMFFIAMILELLLTSPNRLLADNTSNEFVVYNAISNFWLVMTHEDEII